jgi:hypothetical protein
MEKHLWLLGTHRLSSERMVGVASLPMTSQWPMFSSPRKRFATGSSEMEALHPEWLLATIAGHNLMFSQMQSRKSQSEMALRFSYPTSRVLPRLCPLLWNEVRLPLG